MHTRLELICLIREEDIPPEISVGRRKETRPEQEDPSPPPPVPSREPPPPVAARGPATAAHSAVSHPPPLVDTSSMMPVKSQGAKLGIQRRVQY